MSSSDVAWVSSNWVAGAIQTSAVFIFIYVIFSASGGNSFPLLLSSLPRLQHFGEWRGRSPDARDESVQNYLFLFNQLNYPYPHSWWAVVSLRWYSCKVHYLYPILTQPCRTPNPVHAYNNFIFIESADQLKHPNVFQYVPFPIW